MPILHRDFESRGTIDLKKTGAWKYATHPETDVWCCAYCVDDGPVELWLPGDPIPPAWIEAAVNPDWLVVAHNDAFERRLEQHILAPRYGWPLVPIERHRCTMAAALAVALPAKLENVAAALQLTHRKSDSGVMLQMAKPRKLRKGEDPNGIYWFDDDGRREQLYKYCIQDVEVERELHHRLPPLSPEEQQLWLIDQVINDRGFHVDRKLAEAARCVAAEEQVRINKQLAELTGGAATTINQVEKIVAFVQSQGHQLSGLTKRSVSAVLAHGPDDNVREILELRRRGARASVRKLDALFDRIDADDRLRDCLQFHAASTGRWSGRGFQPQNLKKPEGKDLAAAVDAVLTGNLDNVRAIGEPLSVTGDISRSIINAAPGHILIGADFSAIESRVLAWCAGEKWKLDAYREFDRTGNDRLEPYCVAASRVLKRTVTKDDEAGRAIGKLCDLGFGFGGGLGAWRNFDKSNTYSDADVEQFKTAWRREHKATVRFWHGIERAAHRAIRTGQRTEHRMFAFTMENGTLFMVLPSGRRLAYPEARLVPGKFEGTREVGFKDNAGGRWVESGAWYGTLVENAVQAISRDLLSAAMQRLEAAGYPIVLHVHDEIISEAPEGFSGEGKFVEIMTAPPNWAPGLPIAAKPWTGKRYAKSDSKKASPRPAEHPTVQPAVTKATPEPEKSSTSDQKPSEALPWEGATTFESVCAPVDNDDSDDSDDIDGLPDLAALIDEPLNDSNMMCCPFHSDKTPSLKVYRDHYHCFGCQAHGDRVDWLMLVKGMERGEALEFLDNWQGSVSRPAPERDPEDQMHNALRLWKAAKPIGGTPAEKYLADVRRIDITALPADVDEVLRFHPRCPFGPKAKRPCLLALLRNVTTNEPTGIQRIALKPNVLEGGKVERRILGRIGALKIWPVNSHLVIGEGIETVLAAATRIPYKGEPLRPAWSAISSSRLSTFPIIAGVERLIILADNDESGVGQAAAAACASRWQHAGCKVERLIPNQRGSDFNDIILKGNRDV